MASIEKASCVWNGMLCCKRTINFKLKCYYFGLPCGEPGVELNDASGSLPTQDVI